MLHQHHKPFVAPRLPKYTRTTVRSRDPLLCNMSVQTSLQVHHGPTAMDHGA